MVPARAVAIVVALGALTAAARPAAAYEYAVRARTLGQALQLRSFRLTGGDIVLSRRRFTQTLMLDIDDIGDYQARRRKIAPHRAGPVVRFTSYLRIDHDFGDWTMGTLQLDGRTVDAIDAVPELASSSLALDLLYAYVSVDGLAAGVVDLRVGRQVTMDLLDAWAFDGATARVHTPWHVAIEVAGGARVRDGSPLGAAVYELDGLPSADCREYVEGASAGAGSWQIVDRSRVIGESKFTADLDYCPMREQLMPTFGVAVETEGLRRVHARLSYRRSMSRTVGLIGEVDRLDFPDISLYPDESGQAPRWGINEERLGLVVDGRIEARGGRVLLTPWAGARWSLLHGLVDQAVVGMRARWGDHALEPEVGRSVPTFDGDSIFNVFAIEPSTDLRLGYDLAPRRGRLRATAGLWLRRYELGDAGGATAGAEWRGARLALRLDGLLDGGYGGRRAGATASLRWKPGRHTVYGARAGVLGIEPDDGTGAVVGGNAVHGTLQLGGTWEILDGVGLHAVGEGTASRITPGQVRFLTIVDFAFVPEI